jgi:hypothetical protein
MNPRLPAFNPGEWLRTSSALSVVCILALLLASRPCAQAQESVNVGPGRGSTPSVSPESNQELQQRVEQLEKEMTELRKLVKELQSGNEVLRADAAPAANGIAASSAVSPIPLQAVAASPDPASPVVIGADDRKTLDYLHGTTINVGIDGYYGYNFNAPVGRVNLLRAYDVLSNNFSLNQASVIFDHPPDVGAGRRWGGRLDLQFGQATDTLQGNPLNEPRPDIYRNIFQVYGTYVVPVGRGLNGFWQMGKFTRDRRQLYQGPNQLFPVVLL